MGVVILTTVHLYSEKAPISCISDLNSELLMLDIGRTQRDKRENLSKAIRMQLSA